jgi:hypothetical protein
VIAGMQADAGEHLNGIYLGADVSSIDGKNDIAVQIREDGTVLVYIGALVPGIRDKQGKEVRVRRVQVVKD